MTRAAGMWRASRSAEAVARDAERARSRPRGARARARGASYQAGLPSLVPRASGVMPARRVGQERIGPGLATGNLAAEPTVVSRDLAEPGGRRGLPAQTPGRAGGRRLGARLLDVPSTARKTMCPPTRRGSSLLEPLAKKDGPRRSRLSSPYRHSRPARRAPRMTYHRSRAALAIISFISSCLEQVPGSMWAAR